MTQFKQPVNFTAAMPAMFFLQSNYGQNDVGAADWLIVQDAKSDKWKIKPGDKYRKITYREAAGFVTYRGRIEMDKLCARHELFDE